MKKLFALLLAFCMLLTLAACGAGDTAPDSAGGQEGGTSSGEVSLLTAEERAKEFITVATGPTSGVYYPIGGAFATALGAWGYKTSAEATNATGANIQLILDGDAEIAIAMQDAVMQAYTATGAYEGSAAADSLRALMRLWPNYVQLVTTSNTGIHSVEDLRGKRVGVGAANSGVEINARMILAAYGMSYDDIQPDYLAYGEAIDNMKNGQCDAVFVTSGLPNATVMDLGVSYDMVVVPIDGAVADKLIADCPFYTAYSIPAGTYKGQDADVTTVTVKATLIVSASAKDEDVYNLTKAIFDNVDAIAAENGKGKELSVENATSGMSAPFHAGAAKYYAEKGVTVESK